MTHYAFFGGGYDDGIDSASIMGHERDWHEILTIHSYKSEIKAPEAGVRTSRMSTVANFQHDLESL